MLNIEIENPTCPHEIELQELRESNASLKKRQTEIDAQLLLAASVQQSLAPRSLIWNEIAVETHYSPVHTIGGDFGVVFPHNEESLTIVMCDVSGHGIAPALMANRIYSETLRQLDHGLRPCDLLRQLQHFAHMRVATHGFYFTMAALHFRMGGRRATFVGGGHPPAMHVSKGGVRLLESQNPILGCVSKTAAQVLAEDIELAPGDRLVLYTDGLVEVFDSFDDMLGVEGLKNLVLESANLSLPEMSQSILDGVAAWRHGPIGDDVSLIIVEAKDNNFELEAGARRAWPIGKAA
jgi:phosphoserine phosphatase RsbU/P